MKKTILIVAVTTVVILFLIWVAATWLGNESTARNKFEPGNEIYHRDIILLLDATGSVNSGDTERFDGLKSKIKSYLLPNLGLGDRIRVFKIDSDFDEIGNSIFESTSLPKVPRNAIKENLERFDIALKKALLEDTEEFNKKTIMLEDSINNVKLKHNKSNYYEALRTAGEILTASKSKLKQIVIFGDLINDPWQKTPPAITQEEAKLFEGIKILIVYPTGVHKVNAKTKSEVINHWEKYFDERRGKDRKIIPLSVFEDYFNANQIPSSDELSNSIKID